MKHSTTESLQKPHREGRGEGAQLQLRSLGLSPQEYHSRGDPQSSSAACSVCMLHKPANGFCPALTPQAPLRSTGPSGRALYLALEHCGRPCHQLHRERQILGTALQFCFTLRSFCSQLPAASAQRAQAGLGTYPSPLLHLGF